MIRAGVSFDQLLHPWDGFGVNYVAAAQSRDYAAWAQDYGSFDIMTEQDRRTILDLVFGPDGLQPTIGKLFIDSLQAGFTKPAAISQAPDQLVESAYDHETTTTWMRWFWREGLKLVKERGETVEFIATLYGPPPWASLQKIVRGRDLDQAQKYEVAKYIIAFARFMRDREGFAIKYLALHNEGEFQNTDRWPKNGTDSRDHLGHDYNMILTTDQVIDFIKFMPELMKRYGIGEMGLTPGECCVLPHAVPYAEALAADPVALKNLALFTSHAFGNLKDPLVTRALEILQGAKPDLKFWITSETWGKMDMDFIWRIHAHIYRNKANGYIPWALIQRHSQWTGGDPNPGAGILVDDTGSYTLTRGYWLYKHWCRVGKAGMHIAATHTQMEDLLVAGFASAGSRHPDAAVIINNYDVPNRVELSMSGTSSDTFSSVLTTRTKQYCHCAPITLTNGVATLDLPPWSIMTLQ